MIIELSLNVNLEITWRSVNPWTTNSHFYFELHCKHFLNMSRAVELYDDF